MKISEMSHEFYIGFFSEYLWFNLTAIEGGEAVEREEFIAMYCNLPL